MIKPTSNTPQKTGTINRYIKTEAELSAYLDNLKTRKISSIALDMEGDQGTLRYAYSVSIFQCFDQTESVIIDVLAMGNNKTLVQFLTDPALTKIMFSCANDIFMAQNVLGCTIFPVRDIAVGQKLLAMPINLSDYLSIDKREKDIFQRANWLKRPISKELLEYAINDVLNLFTIETEIATKLRTAKLYAGYIKESELLTRKNYIIDQMQHYKAKFPGYPRLRPAEKHTAACIWVFRELLGKHVNCPVGYILSKPAMSAILKKQTSLRDSLLQELNHDRSFEKHVKVSLVEKYLQEARGLVESHLL